MLPKCASPRIDAEPVARRAAAGCVLLKQSIVLALVALSACAQDKTPVPPPADVVDRINSLMEMRRFDDAIEYLHDQAASHPNMLQLNLNLGFAYGNKGDHERAIEYFERELELKPESWLAVSLLGQACENLGQHEEALRHFEAWKAIQPDRWEPYLRAGNTCLELGRTECAQESFDGGLRLSPQNSELLVGMGKVQLSTDDLAGARESFGRAILHDAYHVDAHYNLGQTLARMGQEEEARRVLEQFRHLSKQKEQMDFLQQSRDIEGSGAENAVALGDAFLQRGQLDQALREYKSAVNIDSTLWLGYHRVATIRTRQKQYSQALALLDRASRLNPATFEVPFDQSKNHALVGKISEAMHALDRAQSVRALTPREAQFISELFVRSGMVREGLAILSAEVKRNPADHESMFVMGLLLHLTDDVSEAEKRYRRATSLSDDNTAYKVAHAMSLLSLRRTAEAETLISEISEADLVGGFNKYKSLKGAELLSPYVSSAGKTQVSE